MVGAEEPFCMISEPDLKVFSQGIQNRFVLGVLVKCLSNTSTIDRSLTSKVKLLWQRGWRMVNVTKLLSAD